MSTALMMMVVELCRILINDLLCILHRGVMCCVSLCLCRQSFRWRIIREQILNGTFSGGSLVDGEGSRKLPMSTCLYSIQQIHGEILTVIANEVVGCSFLPHVMDRHLPCR